MADSIIQGYNWLNGSGIVSTFVFFLMTMLTLGLMFRLFRRAKDE